MKTSFITRNHGLTDLVANPEVERQRISIVSKFEAFAFKSNQSSEAIVAKDQDLESVGSQFNDTRTFWGKVQKWEGFVVTLNENRFTARLRDLIEGGYDEVIEFDCHEVSPSDRDLLKVGGIFYWNVGYSRVKGQVKKESFIRFKRLPEWTPHDIDSISDRVNVQLKRIQPDATASK